jgi:hypothetical protein
MKVARLGVQLWLAAACSGGGASAPPGQPTPQPAPRVSEPVARTLKETEAQLLEDLSRVPAEQPTRRLVTVYYVEDEAAAELLSDWLRRHDQVAAVRLGHSADATRFRGVGNRYAGELSVTEQRFWELVIESSPGVLQPNDVTSWVRLLADVPRDSRWRLGPSMVEQP